ncbi:MAG: hypothetical protein AAF485_01825 [Chloroflexota bacterium]
MGDFINNVVKTEWLTWVIIIITLVGFVVLIVAIFIHTQRTRTQIPQSMWIRRDLLTEQEYILHRVGFWVTTIGMLIMLLVFYLI